MGQLSPAVVEVAIEASGPSNIAGLLAALSMIASDDPALTVSTDAESGQTILKGSSESHLDRTVDRLLKEFEIQLRVGARQVAYREVLTHAVEIDYTHKALFGPQQTVAGVQIHGGRTGGGQFARVRVLFEPLPRGSGYSFRNAVTNGTVPAEFVPGVERGLAVSRENGVAWGYPLIDFQATLLDGAFHEMDSSALTFEIAARATLRELKTRKAVALIEPVMRLEVTTPDDLLGAVVGDIASRRGQVKSVALHGGLQLVVADVPLADLLGYDASLSALTGRIATATMIFSHYAEVPQQIPDGDPPRFPPAIGMRA